MKTSFYFVDVSVNGSQKSDQKCDVGASYVNILTMNSNCCCNNKRFNYQLAHSSDLTDQKKQKQTDM